MRGYLPRVSQAGLMKALPQVDRETADTLRARQHSQESAGTSLATSATVDVLSSDGAESCDTTAIMEVDVASQDSSQVSRDDDVYSDASSSCSSGAGFVRGGPVIRLLSLAPFSSASGSSSSSSSDRQRPPLSEKKEVESGEQQEADALPGIQNSIEGSLDCDQPTNMRTDDDRIAQHGNGATSAQPAAPSYGGLPSPDSSIGSVATPAISSKLLIAEGQQLQGNVSSGRSVDRSRPGGPRGADLIADADHPPPARRVIRAKEDWATAGQQHQQRRHQSGRGPPSSAGAVQGGSPDASRKGRTARSGAPGRASDVPSRRRPMQSLFWVLKHRSRETAQLRGTGSFALVAEAARDGSVPRVCDLQGDVRLTSACCRPSRLHPVSICAIDGDQVTIANERAQDGHCKVV